MARSDRPRRRRSRPISRRGPKARSGPRRWPLWPPPSASARSSGRRSRPLFIFPPLGLASPLIVFALIGGLVLAAVALRLPDDTPQARGARARSSLIPRSAPADAPVAREDGRPRAPPALARPAGAALADRRRGRRARPGRRSGRDRLPRHRPARRAARPCPAMDRDRADGGRGRLPARPMVADPLARPRPAPARPVGVVARRDRHASRPGCRSASTG